MPKGQSFQSLIPTDLVELQYDITASGDEVAQIDPEIIDPNPHQPRNNFDEKELFALADSIKLHGILQPLVLTPAGNRFHLVAGERRLRAAKSLSLTAVPAIVRDFNEQQKVELALIENLQRAELNPIETATAYQKLISQFNLSHAEVARRIGRDKSTVTNTLRLLGLPERAKEALVNGEISEGHGRAILTLHDPEKRAELVDLVIKNHYSVRQTEEFARSYGRHEQGRERAFKRVAGFSGGDEISKKLTKLLGKKVQTLPTAVGGRLVIYFNDESELEVLAEAIERGWKGKIK